MRKIMITLGLALMISNVAYADGNAFTPLNFNDTAYGSSTGIYPASTNAISEAEAIGNGNIQNAISQLENAQIDIRNDLLNCKTKFADVDAQYKLIKSERIFKIPIYKLICICYNNIGSYAKIIFNWRQYEKNSKNSCSCSCGAYALACRCVLRKR